ncbi:hypothetical protein J6590_072223 [Homalodisca vitripennis]|nr:hypothetical protein J6590_072223 [Homalodisca vitripennis]
MLDLSTKSNKETGRDLKKLTGFLITLAKKKHLVGIELEDGVFCGGGALADSAVAAVDDQAADPSAKIKGRQTTLTGSKNSSTTKRTRLEQSPADRIPIEYN